MPASLSLSATSMLFSRPQVDVQKSKAGRSRSIASSASANRARPVGPRLPRRAPQHRPSCSIAMIRPSSTSSAVPLGRLGAGAAEGVAHASPGPVPPRRDGTRPEPERRSSLPGPAMRNSVSTPPAEVVGLKYLSYHSKFTLKHRPKKKRKKTTVFPTNTLH